MTARRVLDVIADILILLALAVAAVGHLLPWVETRAEGLEPTTTEIQHEFTATDIEREFTPMEVQQWYALRSGAALGAAALLVGISLAFDPGVRLRKLLALLTFASVFVAVVFQVMIYSPYVIATAPRLPVGSSVYETDAFLLAVVPTVIAGALCLIRMTWTMTASTSTTVPRSRSSEFN